MSIGASTIIGWRSQTRVVLGHTAPVLLVAAGCTDVLGVGDLSSTDHRAGVSGAMFGGGSSHSGRAGVGGAGSAGAQLGGSHQGGSDVFTSAGAGASSVGGNASTAGSGGDWVQYGGSPTDGGALAQGGAVSTGGNSHDGGSGAGGSIPNMGGSSGSNTGTASTSGKGNPPGGQASTSGGADLSGVGGRSNPLTQGGASTVGGISAGSGASAGGQTASGGVGNAAGAGGEASNCGTAGSGGSDGRTSAGTTTIFNMVDWLLDLTNQPGPNSLWQLRSMLRTPMARAQPMTGLTYDYDLPSQPIDSGIRSWSIGAPYFEPAVVVNLNTWRLEAAPQLYLPPRSVTASPGPNLEYADIMWVAPASGIAAVEAEFLGIDAGGGTTTDVHFLFNGELRWSDLINGVMDRAVASFAAIPVQRGDMLEFAVGPGSNDGYRSDSTDVRVTIVLVRE